MKKIILQFSVYALTGVLFTSCLKDGGFDNRDYGINDPDTQPPGVGFALGNKDFHKTTAGFEVSASAQAVNGVIYINLLAGKPSASDIVIDLQLNDELRKAYNNALPAASLQADSIWRMPANLYTPPMRITIPAGQNSGQIALTVSSTMTLDPNNTYGIGLTIASATGGYRIAGNMKDLLVEVVVKNRYHGEYDAVGRYYHPSIIRVIDEEKFALTSGANSIDIAVADLAGANYYARFTIDPVTNRVAITAAPGSAGGAFTQFDGGLPTTSPGYTPQWTGSGTCNNTYDPVSKTFFVRYGYSGVGGFRVTEEHIKMK